MPGTRDDGDVQPLPRPTPEVKGLLFINWCEKMLAAKRLSEDGQREQQDNENNKKGTEK